MSATAARPGPSTDAPAAFRETAPSAANVILIVLDTVRAESLSLYGYHRDTTPNLTRLAARGVRFDRAFATAPWTAPSHASMFTGRWCHELSVGWNRPLDGTSPTLAEFLGARGYATAGFVANTTYCSYETGLDRGFAHYEDYDVTLHAVLLCSCAGATHAELRRQAPGDRLCRRSRRRPSRSRPAPVGTARVRRGSTAIFWTGWTASAARPGPALLRLPELLRRPPPVSAARTQRLVRRSEGSPAPRPTSGC